MVVPAHPAGAEPLGAASPAPTECVAAGAHDRTHRGIGLREGRGTGDRRLLGGAGKPFGASPAGAGERVAGRGPRLLPGHQVGGELVGRVGVPLGLDRVLAEVGQAGADAVGGVAGRQ